MGEVSYLTHFFGSPGTPSGPGMERCVSILQSVLGDEENALR